MSETTQESLCRDCGRPLDREYAKLFTVCDDCFEKPGRTFSKRDWPRVAPEPSAPADDARPLTREDWERSTRWATHALTSDGPLTLSVNRRGHAHDVLRWMATIRAAESRADALARENGALKEELRGYDLWIDP